eukprot:867568_1
MKSIDFNIGHPPNRMLCCRYYQQSTDDELMHLLRYIQPQLIVRKVPYDQDIDTIYTKLQANIASNTLRDKFVTAHNKPIVCRVFTKPIVCRVIQRKEKHESIILNFFY